MNQVGISLYLSSGFEKNYEVVAKAKQANASFAFTSLQIPEEKISNYPQQVRELMQLCTDNDIHMIVDVSPTTLNKLQLTSFHQLIALGIRYIRLDYGFDYEQMVELAHDFHIVINASTFTELDYQELKKRNADFNRFLACHNYYPKPLTGLSLKAFKATNDRLHRYGIAIISFVPGNFTLRGPLYEGLPTIENQRGQDFLQSILETKFEGQADIVLVSDIDITDASWKQLQQYQQGYLTLPCEVDKEYGYLLGKLQHDRQDSSDYLIRSVESRALLQQDKMIEPQNTKNRSYGDICISNSAYLRYQGEIEIMKTDLPADKRVNVIGQIDLDHHKYLPYIQQGFGFVLTQEEK